MKIKEIIQQYDNGLITFDEFFYKITEIEIQTQRPLFEIQKDFVIHIKQANETKQLEKIIQARLIYEKQMLDLWNQFTK